MKAVSLLVSLALLSACSSPSNDTPPAATATPSAPAEAPMPAAPAPTVSSASGVVDAVDTVGKTVTISHGPVAVLKWPAMTMSFKAPNADLSAIKPGDQVDFEFTSNGMDATITTISRKMP